MGNPHQTTQGKFDTIILVARACFMKLLKPIVHNWYRQLIRHPKHRWWIILGSFLYLLSPVDISADVFPIIGWLDDGLIVSLLVTEASQTLIEYAKNRKSLMLGN
jgi:uncharacterized membrane protein YkvA (DUF1232 family)